MVCSNPDVLVHISLEICFMQTFELLTGRWLFNPQAGQTWTVQDDHLAKMVELTGENFSDKMLAKSWKRNEYFDESGWYTFPHDITLFNSIYFWLISGKLLHIDQLFPVSLKSAMINYGLPEPEATSAAAFIGVCLHLDPEERSSASDLLDHPWLEMAHMSC
jgi:serine/threonine-protein kinase SRPK3